MTQPPNEPPGQDPQYPEYSQEPQLPGYGRPHPGPGPQTGGPQYGAQYGPGAYGDQPPRLPQEPPAGVGPGVRARQRPVPRTGPALGAAGAALLLIGAFIWSAGYLIEGLFGDAFGEDSSEPGTGRRFLGFALFVILAVVGYVLLIARRRGVLGTAGTVLAAAGVPFALTFVTFSVDEGVNNDVVYPISIIVWLLTYLLVPGARGRAAFLTAAAVTLPSYIAVKIVGDAVGTGFFGIAFGRDASAGDTTATDITTAGAVLLVFGVGYYALAALFDRRQRAGVAIAFVIAGFVATAGGLAVLTRDLHAIGLGVLLIVLGLAICAYGGSTGRRFTTWVWAAAVAGGVVTLLAGIVDDSFLAAGVSAIVIGAIVVAAAAAVSKARGEAPDIEEAAPPALAPPG